MNDKNPSLLFIFTGLGRYSWYKLPFLKSHTFCAGLPQVLVFHIQKAFRYKKGKCKCRTASCTWVSVLGVTVGMCKDAKQELHSRTTRGRGMK
jgi:hypothetical protein